MLTALDGGLFLVEGQGEDVFGKSRAFEVRHKGEVVGFVCAEYDFSQLPKEHHQLVAALLNQGNWIEV